MPNKDIDMAVTISDNSGASKQASKQASTGRLSASRRSLTNGRHQTGYSMS